MSYRFLASLGVLATVLIAGLLAPVTAAGQTQSTAPRTTDGRPDLQGIWSYATVTPLERPRELADKEFLTEEEAAAFEAERVLGRNADLNRDELIGAVTDRGVVNGTPETRDLALAYNDFWWDRGTKVVGTRRTSLVIDPPDGRIPALTASAQARATCPHRTERTPHGGPGGSILVRAMHPEGKRRTAHDPGGLQQQLPLAPNTRPCGDFQRADPRRARRPDGRAPAASPKHPPVDGSLAWPVGGRHTGGRDDEL